MAKRIDGLGVVAFSIVAVGLIARTSDLRGGQASERTTTPPAPPTWISQADVESSTGEPDAPPPQKRSKRPHTRDRRAIEGEVLMLLLGDDQTAMPRPPFAGRPPGLPSPAGPNRGDREFGFDGPFPRPAGPPPGAEAEGPEFGNPPPEFRRRPAFGRFGMRFTDSQRAKFEDILKETREPLQQARKSVAESRGKLRKAAAAEKIDESAVRKEAATLANAIADLTIEQSKIRRQLLEVLTEQQREKLESMSKGRPEFPGPKPEDFSPDR